MPGSCDIMAQAAPYSGSVDISGQLYGDMAVYGEMKFTPSRVGGQRRFAFPLPPALVDAPALPGLEKPKEKTCHLNSGGLNTMRKAFQSRWTSPRCRCTAGIVENTCPQFFRVHTNPPLPRLAIPFSTQSARSAFSAAMFNIAPASLLLPMLGKSASRISGRETRKGLWKLHQCFLFFRRGEHRSWEITWTCSCFRLGSACQELCSKRYPKYQLFV